MKIAVTTRVRGPHKKIFEAFDKDLFLKLKPPLLKLEVERFDGCDQGHEVHLKVGLPYFMKEWQGEIIERHIDDEKAYFVDVGKVLPFPLKDWYHKHLVLKVSNVECLIIDEVTFTTKWEFLDYLLHPVMYLVFSLRKRVYRKHLR